MDAIHDRSWRSLSFPCSPFSEFNQVFPASVVDACMNYSRISVSIGGTSFPLIDSVHRLKYRSPSCDAQALNYMEMPDRSQSNYSNGTAKTFVVNLGFS